jgi:rhodanese-related sulfurtransferase
MVRLVHSLRSTFGESRRRRKVKVVVRHTGWQKRAWIALPFVVVLALWSTNAWRTRVIDPVAARQAVQNGALLLDVRTTRAFRAGHISGAINVPHYELDARFDELGDRDREIIIYCHSGNRSAKALRVLERAGFSRVRNLGGMHRWRATSTEP